MVYQGDSLKTSPFPGMLLVIIVVAAMLLFIFQHFQGLTRWAETYGYVLAFAACTLLLLFSALYFMSSVEDFWVIRRQVCAL